MIKISVIIPVYNVEQYLPKCLDSVLNQTLKDIEIICINDESPDNCAQILEEYQKRDSRIIILNQKNSGQGSARNRGLEIAKGRYIQFLDSDDFYEPTCCEEMYNLMEQHKDIDVACFDANIIYDAYEDKKEIDANYFRMHFTGKTKVKPSMAHQLVDVNCWNKIFRKSFLDKYKLYFPEKLHYEDVGFFWFWITKVSYIYFYQKKLTNYLRRKGSFLGEIYEKSSKTIFDAFKVNELIYDDLVKNNKWHEYKSVFIQAYLLKIKWLINCFSKEQYQNRKKLIDICSAFLSQFDVKNFNLNDNELCCYESIINKNYYLYDAYKKYDIEIVHPIYNNSVNIVFSADKNYIPYLSVTIQSIVSNSTLDDNYDIVILYNELYDYQKRFILSICKAHPNISIRFFNMNNF
uniref:glycosyltransferase n=1 Tax=Candidatus Scatocola faecipullorum TaxID=2840917 RepID=UPI0040277C7D